MLGGDTFVRTNGQLIRLDQLSGTGPAGPQGEQGPQGIQGEPGQDGADGTVDTTISTIRHRWIFGDDEHSIDWNISGRRYKGVG